MACIVQLVDGVVSNRFEISGSELKLGRSSVNQVVIDDLAVSSEHAEIRVMQDENACLQYVLYDLSSTNGCFINEQEVKQQTLRHKDILRIGWNSFTFMNEDEVNLEKTTKVKKSWIPGIYYSDK